jgi:hypothetical protein
MTDSTFNEHAMCKMIVYRTNAGHNLAQGPVLVSKNLISCLGPLDSKGVHAWTKSYV